MAIGGRGSNLWGMKRKARQNPTKDAKELEKNLFGDISDNEKS